MKLSELRPCVGCKGPLTNKYGAGSWYVVTISQAMLSPRAANEVLGLTQFFQGNLALAEVMGSSADDAVLVFGDKDPQLLKRFAVCAECACRHPLVELLEAFHEAESRTKATA